MIFQLVDDKSECVGIYYNGHLYFDGLPQELSATWKYSPKLKGQDIKYGYLYAEGRSLNEVCPDDLLPEWSRLSNKLRAFRRAFGLAKININDYCIYDILPESYLKAFLEVKNVIVAHVFDTFDRPKNYDFLEGIHKLTTDISQHKLNLNDDFLRSKGDNVRAQRLLRSLPSLNPVVSYEVFGAKTGGLRTKKGTFNIMSLDRDLRGVLEPNNTFLEIDYNSMHLRVMLGLCGYEQPQEDLHEYNRRTFFKREMTRDEIKRQTFGWLYNEGVMSPLSEVYSKKKILDKYWHGDRIVNEYGREIICDKHHALNYILSSTANDLFLRQAIKIGKLLEGKKSHITALIQDSILIDFCEDEEYLIGEVTEIFSRTFFGDFRINIRKGINWGEMK